MKNYLREPLERFLSNSLPILFILKLGYFSPLDHFGDPFSLVDHYFSLSLECLGENLWAWGQTSTVLSFQKDSRVRGSSNF